MSGCGKGTACHIPTGVCAGCETKMKGAVGHKYDDLYWYCSKQCWRKR